MVEKAESEGKGVMERLDYVADESVKTWEALQISYTDFIRTTEPDHHAFVQKVLKSIYETPLQKGGSDGGAGGSKEENADIYL
jgi:methionyl-tRNA synthetase